MKVPIWLTAVIAFVSMGLTLAGDRIAVAATISSLQTRVDQLQTVNDKIFIRLDNLDRQAYENAMKLQKIDDREGELARKLSLIF